MSRSQLSQIGLFQLVLGSELFTAKLSLNKHEQFLSMTLGCILTLNQGHTSISKVTVYTRPTFVSRTKNFTVDFTANLDLKNILHYCF